MNDKLKQARNAFEARHFGYEFPSDDLRDGALNEFSAGWFAALASLQAQESGEAREKAALDAMSFGTGAYLQNPDGSCEHVQLDRLRIELPAAPSQPQGDSKPTEQEPVGTPKDEWPTDANEAIGHLAGLAFEFGMGEEIGHCVGLINNALAATQPTIDSRKEVAASRISELRELLAKASDGHFDYSKTQDVIWEGVKFLDEMLSQTPYAYSYLNLDGRRDWRMASSRRKQEDGWTEIPLCRCDAPKEAEAGKEK